MVVITLSDCPPKVRGDLSKWLFEINTGVYVGNLSTRVRQELWQRICENLKNGRATMVYSAPGEQQMRFEIHNSLWQAASGFRRNQTDATTTPGQKIDDRSSQ